MDDNIHKTEYSILFMDILSFLGLGYKDASLIILNLVVIGIITLKIR